MIVDFASRYDRFFRNFRCFDPTDQGRVLLQYTVSRHVSSEFLRIYKIQLYTYLRLSEVSAAVDSAVT